MSRRGDRSGTKVKTRKKCQGLTRHIIPRERHRWARTKVKQETAQK
jgi:hypothetical protein